MIRKVIILRNMETEVDMGYYFDVHCIILTKKWGFMVDMVISVDMLNVAKYFDKRFFTCHAYYALLVFACVYRTVQQL